MGQSHSGRSTPPRHRTRNNQRRISPEPKPEAREQRDLKETRLTRAVPQVKTKQTQQGPVRLLDASPAPQAGARTKYTRKTSAARDAKHQEPPTAPPRSACTEYVMVTPKQIGRGPGARGCVHYRIRATLLFFLVSEKVEENCPFG